MKSTSKNVSSNHPPAEVDLSEIALSEIALSIDTSSSSGSLSIFRITATSYSLISSKFWCRQHSHSENLILECLELLKVCELRLEDVDHILVTHGPGSFTGIRVGLNFAKTLAYGLSKPVYTIDTLTAIAYGKRASQNPLVVINNAHKNMLYLATFSTQPFSIIQTPIAIPYNELEKFIADKTYVCLGDGYSSYKTVFTESALRHLLPSEEILPPISQTLGEFWCENKKKISALQWNNAIPLYIRASEAEERLWKGPKSF